MASTYTVTNTLHIDEITETQTISKNVVRTRPKTPPRRFNEKGKVGRATYPVITGSASKGEVSAIISSEGATLLISGTGLKLIIPRNAIECKTEITMRIIRSHRFKEQVASFGSNTMPIIELLPDKLPLRVAASLILPHSVYFSRVEKAKGTTYLSHHNSGDDAIWEEMPDIPCEVSKLHATLKLRNFCWVTCQLFDTQIVAKRLLLCPTVDAVDSLLRVKFECQNDVPGSLLGISTDTDIRRFVFRKDGNYPLKVQFDRTIMENVYTNVDKIRQRFCYEDIELEASPVTEFYFKKKKTEDCFFTFLAWQEGGQKLRLSIPVKVDAQLTKQLFNVIIRSRS